MKNNRFFKLQKFVAEDKTHQKLPLEYNEKFRMFKTEFFDLYKPSLEFAEKVARDSKDKLTSFSHKGGEHPICRSERYLKDFIIFTNVNDDEAKVRVRYFNSIMSQLESLYLLLLTNSFDTESRYESELAKSVKRLDANIETSLLGFYKYIEQEQEKEIA